MSKTTVVNFRKEKCDVKITRTPKNEVPDPPEFGCFGNPFFLELYGREKCIEMFRDYFLRRVETDPVFREAVLTLKGKKLGCFCRPENGFNGQLLCHGQIMAAWIDGCKPEEIT